MSRNSITPSRALRTIGERVLTSGGSPLGPGRQSRTPQAQLATGFGEPTSSTRHMRQLPAIDSRSWKQKRGISAPAISHACNSVYSGGTSISAPSTISLVMSVQNHPDAKHGRDREARRDVEARQQGQRAPEAVMREDAHAHLAAFQSSAAARSSQANA